MSQSLPPVPRQIPTDKRFYITKRDAGHEDWRFAFWRELFQNSTDSGSTTFKISMALADAVGAFDREFEPHKVLRVEFEDNGSGMTRDVLENVFFSVGRTTKSGMGGQATGGFGTARIMLCFSQDSYQVHTGGMIAEGDGGEYLITVAPPGSPDLVTKGCRFVIDIDQRRGGDFGWMYCGFEEMKEKLEEYLSFSQVSGKVTLNGQPMDMRLMRGPVRRTLVNNDVPFANVHLSEGSKAKTGKLIVRQNGSAMFTRSIASRKQLIVEIDPARGREILTENRDGMTAGYNNALGELIRMLELDVNSAVKEQKLDHLTVIHGSLGTLRSRWVAPRPAQAAEGAEGAEARTSTQFGDDTVKPAEREKTAIRLSGNTKHKLEEHAQVYRGIPDVIVHVSDLSGAPQLSAAARRWNPLSWGGANPENGTIGTQMHQTLIAWSTACSYAVSTLQRVLRDERNYGNIEFVPGWYFAKPEPGYENGIYSESAAFKAVCSKLQGDNRVALLLNPVDRNGKARYSISSFDDPKPDDPNAPLGLKSIIALSLHEAAHIAESYHGEAYATLLTSMMEKVDQRAVWRAMQDAMAPVSRYYKHVVKPLVETREQTSVSPASPTGASPTGASSSGWNETVQEMQM